MIEKDGTATPSDVMYVALQNGSITMVQYVEWFKTDKSWEDVKNIISDEKPTKENRKNS